MGAVGGFDGEEYIILILASRTRASERGVKRVLIQSPWSRRPSERVVSEAFRRGAPIKNYGWGSKSFVGIAASGSGRHEDPHQNEPQEQNRLDGSDLGSESFLSRQKRAGVDA